MRKTTNTFASSSIVSGIGDVDDNPSVSSFDDEMKMTKRANMLDDIDA